MSYSSIFLTIFSIKDMIYAEQSLCTFIIQYEELYFTRSVSHYRCLMKSFKITNSILEGRKELFLATKELRGNTFCNWYIFIWLLSSTCNFLWEAWQSSLYIYLRVISGPTFFSFDTLIWKFSNENEIIWESTHYCWRFIYQILGFSSKFIKLMPN